jgi:hypothetical protein
MTKTQKVIIGVLAVAACVLLVCTGSVILSYRSSILSPVNTQPSPQPAIETTSTPSTIQSSPLYVIDEVLWASSINPQCGGDVSITYSNNTGGTNQWDGGIGDGKSDYSSNCETLNYKPFRVWFSAQNGDIFSLIAQGDDNVVVTGIVCNIYLADYQGAQCLVNDNRQCGKITLWKNSSCYGAFCVCQTSGMVGR